LQKIKIEKIIKNKNQSNTEEKTTGLEFKKTVPTQALPESEISRVSEESSLPLPTDTDSRVEVI